MNDNTANQLALPYINDFINTGITENSYFDVEPKVIKFMGFSLQNKNIKKVKIINKSRRS